MHTRGLLPTHTPAWQASVWVQALLSVHGVVSGIPVHAVTGVLPAQPKHW
jgi:hypothetical protein